MSWITRSRLVMKDGISLKYLLIFHTETWDICHFILSSNVTFTFYVYSSVQDFMCFWLQRNVYYERVCNPSLKPEINAIESG